VKNRIPYVLAVAILAAVAVGAANESRLKAIRYTSDGGLAVPDYSRWVFIGSGLGMSYTDQTGGNPHFTNVFAEPEAYSEYMKNGVWPDRTILALEMRASSTNLSIIKGGWAQTGNVVGAPEMEVKDKSKGGWLFYGVRPGETVGRPLPKTIACYSCHAEHGAVDNTFVQFYPSLIEAAKRNGTYKEHSK
jgi:hypothetical protein